MTANGRVGATAAVYTAAILGERTVAVIFQSAFFTIARDVSGLIHTHAEYLTAEVLELAGNASKDLKVSSRDVPTRC